MAPATAKDGGDVQFAVPGTGRDPLVILMDRVALPKFDGAAMTELDGEPLFSAPSLASLPTETVGRMAWADGRT